MKKFIYPLLLSHPWLGMAQELAVNDLLNVPLEELMELQVNTASKVAEKIGEVPASVVLLTRQEIQRYGYTSLTEILQHVSGAYEIDSYGAGGGCRQRRAKAGE